MQSQGNDERRKRNDNLDLSRRQQTRPIHLIGVPIDLGAGRRGVDMGPSALRIAGIAHHVARLGYAVVDRGDLTTPTPETRRPGNDTKKFIREIARICQRLCRAAGQSMAEGALPVVLGGDHSLAAGSVAAAAAHVRITGGTLGLVWVDAHADMNTPASSPSGNVHGMPLAALLGPEPRELAGLGGFSPTVRPEHTVLVGIRNLDQREKQLVRDAGVRVFTMSDIDRTGIAAVADAAIAIAGRGTSGIHVSFDMDVCDPSIAPGVGTAVRGGLNYREAHLLLETVAASGQLTSLDVVEVNPILDTGNTTAVLAVELVLSALGKQIL